MKPRFQRGEPGKEKEEWFLARTADRELAHPYIQVLVSFESPHRN